MLWVKIITKCFIASKDQKMGHQPSGDPWYHLPSSSVIKHGKLENPIEMEVLLGPSQRE